MSDGLLHNPGRTPFERIAVAADYDHEVCARLAYEQGVALSEGLAHGATPGELRLLALNAATTALAVYAMLGSGIPLAALRAHAESAADILEGKAAAA